MSLKKSLIFITICVFQVCLVQAQDLIMKDGGAIITFEEKMKDLGDITYGDSLNYVFKFKNTGNEDLVIKNVVVTCSCTSRKYTEGTIASGQSGELVVSFDSNKQDKVGRQNKVITILSNARNNPERVILNFNILEK